MLFAKSPKLFGLLAALSSCAVSLPATYGETNPNTLTRPETLSGWKLLFDGKSVDGWRNYKKETVSDGWKVKNGELSREGKDAGDLVTKQKYKYFELILEYKISEGGNSGLMFHVNEDNPNPWQSGPEIQIQDNAGGHDPQLSGWLYQMYKPSAPPWVKESGVLDATRPAGQWNELFLRISPSQCEVSMNGCQYYRFKIGDKQWKDLVEKSKFAQFPGFGAAGEGYLCLQDHGNPVSFRNIKIRELPASPDAPVPQPVDAVLPTTSKLAFPKLKWEGWDVMDEDGNANKPLRVLELTYAKGDSNRLFAIDQRGWIFAFENRPDVEKSHLVLDISKKVNRWFDPGANEQGLLGLAMHPRFKDNGELFVYYTKRENNHSIVSRFRMSKDDPNKANPDSEEILLDVAQPFQNHNGGSIEFGPDGFLYVGFGDGGSRNDPNATGQDRSQLLGSIIRIDVDSKSNGLPYGIPADNPFVSTKGARPEIYAHGLRNPWRISFDKKTGRLWCGDVGQELFEEVNVITKGGNYGWSNREGTHAFGNRPTVAGVGAPIDPVWEYDHTAGKSITGGRVFNSGRIPELTGKYIYADYVTGSVWALTYDPATGKAVRNEQVLEKGIPVVAFGEDQNGEIYYMKDSSKGEFIYRFEKRE